MHPGRARALLPDACSVSNPPAADRTTQIFRPQFLAARGIQRIEISAHVAEQDQAPGGRGDASHQRIRRVKPPFALAGIRVAGSHPAGTHFWVVLLAESLSRTSTGLA